MNDPQAISPAIPETGNLGQQCACLHRQVITLLLALIVVSGTLSVFMWRQARYARRDLDAMKRVNTPLLQEFNRNRSVVDASVGKLLEYGRTHPDFAPILQKYRLAQPTTAAPPATATAPKK